MTVERRPARGKNRIEQSLRALIGSAMDSGPVRLMLLDDHASVRESLSLLLDLQKDMTVVAEAGTLAEARALIPTVDVNIALVDLDLPDGNGAEFIRELRKRNPHAHSLVITGLTDRGAYAHAVGAGAAGVLHKSAPVKEIVDAIRRIAEGRVILSPEEAVELLRKAETERREEHNIEEAVHRLTPRQREILSLLGDGLSDKEIAVHVGVQAKTVRNHMTGVLDALGVESRIQALILAAKYGVINIAASHVTPAGPALSCRGRS